MSRLTRNLLFGVTLVLTASCLLVLGMSKRPPRIARLLPEADAIVYANLKPARLATHFDRSAPARSPEFQSFVEATGIVPERDLDEVAFALTRRADPGGPNGPVAYTEVFSGRFDPARLTPYLAGQSISQEQYAGHTLYTLPSGGPGPPEPRVLRVSLLRPGLIVASNAATAEQIHVVIDHDRAGLLGEAPPSLLSDHFADVPALSAAWGIGSLGLPFSESGHVAVMGLDLPLPANQPMIASLRYLGVLRLRIVALAPSSELAMQQAGALTGLLGLVRTLGARRGGENPQLEAALTSAAIAQSGPRTVVTIDVPQEILRQLTLPK